MSPLEKLGAYLAAYASEPDDALTDLTAGTDTAAHVTFGDLRTIRDLAAQAEVLRAGSSCCGHPFVEHSDEGCIHGWEWASGGGGAVSEGCDCDMLGPLRLADVQEGNR